MFRNITERRLSFEGIVFDMDGVLLHSSPIHDAAFRTALSAFPIPNYRYSLVAGMRTVDAIRQILADHGINLPDERIAALAADKSKMALARIVAENPVVPGAIEVLRTLAPRFKLGLASSASPASVDAFLDGNHLRDAFQCIVHSGDVRSAKPSPEIFSVAIERLEIAPGRSLVVEDAVAGLQAAKAAGAFACGIPSTCRAGELVQAGADVVIDRLEDLLGMGAAL